MTKDGKIDLMKKAGLESVHELHSVVLALLENDFEAGGNNLAAWKALSYCREFDLVIPEWVLVYLTDTAKRLCEIGPPGAEARTRVFNAIGVTGKELANTDDPRIAEWIVCRQVEEQLKIPWGGNQRTKKRAQEDVAKQIGKSWSHVRAIHEKWSKHEEYQLILQLAEENMPKK